MLKMSGSEGEASTNTSASTSNNRPAGAGAVFDVSQATPQYSNRSLLFDERFFEEQFLRCQVCHERFDQADRCPKSLPCNHTFCLPCLSQIFDHAQPPARRSLTWGDEVLDGALKCPTCRVEIFLSRNKIKELPNDHRVVQMMDFVSQAVSKSQNTCPKHDRQPLSFFCKKCLIPVCRDCTVLDHKDAEGHTIIDVSEALNENSTQFDEIENKSRDALEKMKNRSDSLANASKRLDILERRLRSDIKETFIEYRLLLEKRQEALTSMVHQIIRDQKTKVNSKFANVCEHGTQLQKLYDEFKASRSNNDIRKLFAINQQIQEHENNFKSIASQDDTEMFQSCEFEAQNEGSFLSDLSGLGEVRSKSDPELKEPVSAHQLVYLEIEEQRERERLLESQASSQIFYDDFIVSGGLMGRADIDDHESIGDEEIPQNYWPGHNALRSRLVSFFAQPRGDEPESMDETDTLTIGSRRPGSRRGRRSRDTNSFQVQSSLAQDALENRNFFVPSHTSASAGTSSSPHTSGRSGSRHRTSASSGSAYRVVRHPTAASLRNQVSFENDDSN